MYKISNCIGVYLIQRIENVEILRTGAVFLSTAPVCLIIVFRLPSDDTTTIDLLQRRNFLYSE